MFAVVVAASCLLSSEKNQWNTAWRGHDFLDEFLSVCGNVLKGSSEIPPIEIDLFTPYYYDCIWWEKLETTLSA